MTKGSLQEKNGKYYAVFRFKGKQKWVNLNISTDRGNKRKAQQALQEVMIEYENRIDNDSDILFTAYMSYWLNEMEYVIKPSTFETYKITVNKKIIPYFEPKGYKLSELKPRDITEFLTYLKLHGKKNGLGMSYKSVKNVRGLLSGALKFAKNNHIINSNPVVDSIMPTFEKDIQKEVITYTPDEVKLLLDTAKESGSHIYIFLLLALYTGLRKGELHALTWHDIDFNKKTLTVNKNRTGTSKTVTQLVTTPKSNSSNRTIPLADNVINALKEEKERQKQYQDLFGNCYIGDHDFVIRNTDGKPYTNLNAINRVMTRLIKKAGLPHCTPHGLRHTVASLLDENGTDLQEISVLLGHENVSTTEKIYIHRKRVAKRDDVVLLDDLYNNQNSEVC